MDGRSALFHGACYLVGTGLVLGALIDVFFTVLYARIGTGLLSHRLGSGVWRLFRRAGRHLSSRHRNTLLSFCGPISLVMIVAVWVVLLTGGFALLIWPKLGSSVQSSQGPTPTGVSSAIYLSGSTLTTAGAGGYVPRTWFYRCLLALESTVGISVITLSLTYLVEVYSALQRRNVFALLLHHATGNSGDAARLLAGLLAGNDLGAAREQIAAMAERLVALFESHHFYTSLLYFRFREPHYALARMALVVMETATLARSALRDRRYVGLVRSAALGQLWDGGMWLLTELAGAALPGTPADEAGPQALEQWRRRYEAAAAELRAAGIDAAAEDQLGSDEYVALRGQWDRYIEAFARYLAYAPEEIDPTRERRP